jgi:transposase-like protein
MSTETQQQHQDLAESARYYLRDLKTLAAQELAQRYGISLAAAQKRRLKLFGSKLRPKNWWISPEILTILTSDLSDRQIGEQLGVSPTYAGRLRQKACLLLDKPRPVVKKLNCRPTNWWQQPELLPILTSELPESQIGAQLGISAGYAGRLRKKACLLLNKPLRLSKGGSSRPTNWWHQPDVLQILTTATSINEIAEKLGISPTHVGRLLQKAHALLDFPRSSKTRPRRPEPRLQNWWHEPATLQILTSNLKLGEIGAKLRISIPHAFQLRKRARALITQSHQQPLAA